MFDSLLAYGSMPPEPHLQGLSRVTAEVYLTTKAELDNYASVLLRQEIDQRTTDNGQRRVKRE